MFDNPKKELERIQEQLLAAEEPAAGDFSDEIYDEIDLNDDSDFIVRSAGFDADIEEYEMDTSRYVPAPKKKRMGKLFFMILLVLTAALAFVAWRQGWLL